MSLLTRINSGGFDIKDSITLDQISQLHEQDTLQPHLFPFRIWFEKFAENLCF